MESFHSANRKIFRFLKLPISKKWFFIKYSLLFTTYILFTRSAGFKRTRRITEDIIRIRLNKINNDSISTADTISKDINRAVANSFFNTTCLEKSLFTYFILGLNGISSELKIGIDKDINSFRAHAWVEKQGIVLSGQENPLEKYSSF